MTSKLLSFASRLLSGLGVTLMLLALLSLPQAYACNACVGTCSTLTPPTCAAGTCTDPPNESSTTCWDWMCGCGTSLGGAYCVCE